MDAPIRFRLHQFSYSPTSISTELILKHSGLGFESKILSAGDPGPIITLTKAESYQDPVLEDLFIRQIIFNRPPVNDDIPRFISELAPLMILFPSENEGLQRILESYIKREVEPIARKVCDVYRDKWVRNEIESGLIRYQREQQFGVGTLEKWTKEIADLVTDFNRAIQPFESVLTKQAFLTGDRPVYADYLLTGSIATFLFPGTVAILNTLVMVEAWYSKMKTGTFKYRENELSLGGEGAAAAFANYVDITVDASEIEKPITEMKMRAGAQALDVMTGSGETAVILAKKAFTVTAADPSHPNLVQTAELANSNQLALTLKQHSTEKLPYADSSFNLVCIRAKAHLIPDPETFVREAARILRTYGYLAVIDNVIPDDQIEADQWLNGLEKLRDPAFVRYYTPNNWRKWCTKVGLTVTKLTVDSLKQPDLNWYLGLKNTPAENRKKIQEMIAKANPASRDLFKLSQEDGKIVWNFRRMTLLAGKI